MPKRTSIRSRTSQRGRPHSKADTPKTGERLQKVLAAAGIASRRNCEELIEAGRVMVDGEIVTKLGTRADPATQEIAVDGQKLKRPKHVYYAVHKPKNVLSTNWDPSGRTRLVDLAPDDKRLFCVGRLDRSSEGLAMLTNDGELAHRIMHPSFGVSKTYIVEVAGSVTSKDVDDLTKGVYLSEGRAKASNVRIKSRRSKSTLLEIELQEGKNREIRRIMAKLDHKVLNLKRIAIGPLRLGDMPSGAYRELTSLELTALRKVSVEAADRPSPKRKRSGPPPEQMSLPSEDFAMDDDYDDEGDFDGELIEVRDQTPLSTARGGIVIGGEHSGGSTKGKSTKKTAKKRTAKKGVRKPSSHGGPGKARKPGGSAAAKRASSGKSGAKKSARGGKPKQKGKR